MSVSTSMVCGFRQQQGRVQKEGYCEKSTQHVRPACKTRYPACMHCFSSQAVAECESKKSLAIAILGQPIEDFEIYSQASE